MEKNSEKITENEKVLKNFIEYAKNNKIDLSGEVQKNGHRLHIHSSSNNE